MLRNIKGWARWPSAALLGTLIACKDDLSRLPKPEVVATSRYLEYSTWADPSPLCMGGRLAAADNFVEEAAALLQSEVPSERSIRYIYVPESLQDPDRTWPCPPSASGCFLAEGRLLEGRSAIYSSFPLDLHELAHAVESHALGIEHWVLQEGLADYLSRAYSTKAILKDFPEALKNDIDRDRPSPDYRAAAHFVGSLIEHHGVGRFKEFALRVGGDDRWDGFSDAFEDEFGEDLEASLAELALAPITAKGVFECEGETISWTKAGEIDVALVGGCGDAFYYSPGGAPETPGAFKTYVFDVSEGANFDFSLTSTGGGIVYGLLQNCDFRASWWTAFEDTRSIPLDPGRHVLSVGFPYSDGTLGELDFHLTRVNP